MILKPDSFYVPCFLSLYIEPYRIPVYPESLKWFPTEGFLSYFLSNALSENFAQCHFVHVYRSPWDKYAYREEFSFIKTRAESKYVNILYFSQPFPNLYPTGVISIYGM